MAEGDLGAVFKGLAKDAEGAVKRISDKIAGFAEDGAARAKASVEDVAKSDRGAHDRITTAGRPPGAASDLDRLKSSLDDATRSKYSDAELDDLLAHGKSLGLTPDESADFATAGAIRKPVSAKYPLGRDRIPPDDLRQQMDNWATEVRTRGYPYLFESAQQFHEFGNELDGLGESFGLPKGKMLVQGSSLRSPAAKDVDIAVVVPDEEFDNYLARCADGIESRAQPWNSPGLLEDLYGHADKGFIPQYDFDRPPGASRTFSQLSRQLTSQYGLPDLDFSIMKQSSAMALYPHLDITRSTP
jgi:hypothetical protein